MAVVVDDKVILYKCPYCVRGRFTAADGWAGAVKHIKENHNGRGRNGGGRGRRKPHFEEDVGLLEASAVG